MPVHFLKHEEGKNILTSCAFHPQGKHIFTRKYWVCITMKFETTQTAPGVTEI